MLPNSQPEKLVYRVREACVALGLGKTSFYKLVRDGQLRLIKIAGRSLVERSELERLVRTSANQ